MPDDKLDALFRQARAAGGQRRSKLVNDEDRQVSGGETPAASKADDRERLVLTEARDQRLYYTLDGDEVRVGDALEVFVNQANGWLYGTFQWTGRERHAPSLKVELRDPAAPADFVGHLEATLPKHARLRRP